MYNGRFSGFIVSKCVSECKTTPRAAKNDFASRYRYSSARAVVGEMTREISVAVRKKVRAPSRCDAERFRNVDEFFFRVARQLRRTSTRDNAGGIR